MTNPSAKARAELDALRKDREACALVDAVIAEAAAREGIAAFMLLVGGWSKSEELSRSRGRVARWLRENLVTNRSTREVRHSRAQPTGGYWAPISWPTVAVIMRFGHHTSAMNAARREGYVERDDARSDGDGFEARVAAVRARRVDRKVRGEEERP